MSDSNGNHGDEEQLVPGSKFTPTQRRMLTILADGKAHTRQELFACLSDDMADLSAIKWHLSKLREKLRPMGQDVICEINMGIKYRHVRLLASPYKE